MWFKRASSVIIEEWKCLIDVNRMIAFDFRQCLVSYLDYREVTFFDIFMIQIGLRGRHSYGCVDYLQFGVGVRPGVDDNRPRERSLIICLRRTIASAKDDERAMLWDTPLLNPIGFIQSNELLKLEESMDERMNECTNVWMNEWTNQWMDEWLAGWMNEWTNGWRNDWMIARLNKWFYDCMNE